MVIAPVPNAARAGSPSRCSRRRRRTSDRVSATTGSSPSARVASSRMRARRASSRRRSQVLSKGTANNRSAASVRSSHHASIGRGAARPSATAPIVRTARAKRPTTTVSLPSTAKGTTSAGPSTPSPSARATPISSWSRPASQVLAENAPGMPHEARWRPSSPQRMWLSPIHRSSRERSSGTRPNRCRTGSRVSSSVTAEAVKRPDTISRRASSAPSTGLRSRRDRSVMRYRSAGGPLWRVEAPGDPADGPNTASISGAKVSSRGLITTMSPSVSDGSAASSPQIASRSASTCRVGPEHACTWMLRSVGCRGCEPSGDAFARTSACTRSSSDRLIAGPIAGSIAGPIAGSARSSPMTTMPAAPIWPANSRLGWAHERSRGWRAASTVGSSRRGNDHERPSPSSPAGVMAAAEAMVARVSAGDSERMNTRTSRSTARAPSSGPRSGGMVLSPKRAMRGGRASGSRALSIARRRPGSRSGGLGRPTRSRTRRNRWGCHTRSASRRSPAGPTSWPLAHAWISPGRCTE